MQETSPSRSPSACATDKLHTQARIQPRSQSDRQAVLRAGAGCGIYRHGALLAHAHSFGVADLANSGPGQAFGGRRARRRDDAGVLPFVDDHARNHHGVLRADQRAVRRVWKLFPSDPNRRGGHGVPAIQHDVVLDDIRCVPRHGRCVFCQRRSADLGMDGVRAVERGWQRRRPGPGDGPEFVGDLHRHLLHRISSGRARTSSRRLWICAPKECR